jgi:hypothetical protein
VSPADSGGRHQTCLGRSWIRREPSCWTPTAVPAGGALGSARDMAAWRAYRTSPAWPDEACEVGSANPGPSLTQRVPTQTPDVIKPWSRLGAPDSRGRVVSRDDEPLIVGPWPALSRKTPVDPRAHPRPPTTSRCYQLRGRKPLGGRSLERAPARRSRSSLGPPPSACFGSCSGGEHWVSSSRHRPLSQGGPLTIAKISRLRVAPSIGSARSWPRSQASHASPR